MKKILSILAAIALSGVMSLTASAQGFAVRGVVVDEMGPVIGAAVLEAGTTNGAVTDLDGNFSIRVSSPDATVEVSCIGYTTQTFKASAMPATITLHEDNEFLDEVVVIGYGTVKKSETARSAPVLSATRPRTETSPLSKRNRASMERPSASQVNERRHSLPPASGVNAARALPRARISMAENA